MSAYKKVRGILGGPIRLLFRVKSHGLENMIRDRGAILCANHTSLCDVFVISSATDVQVKYMAKKELFSVPILKSIIKGLGAFPVDRKGGDVSAIKKTVALVEEGSVVGVFPQGTRHPHVDPRTTEVRHGVGLMAYRAKCDIIPVYIKARKNRVCPFRRSHVYIGEPIPYEALGFSEGGREEYKKASELIFDRICSIGEEAAKQEKAKKEKKKNG